ncbi:MAG: ABC transporter ATP-binding protein [Clostridia bacterium]|nr:ABC transporter ATP-binding protein [Clostridia bacterium]
MNEHLLEVKDLHVSFDTAVGEIKAVRGVDFYLDRGETLCIVGESGCGKSVTIQTLMRLNDEPPASIKHGSILYKDEDIVKKTQKEMRRYRGEEFSMIFQDAMTALNPTTKIGKQMREAIRQHKDISKEDAKKLILEMLTLVGLPNPAVIYDRFPHTLSGGQRQRVMIAMALSLHPSILLADEPTTALDVTIQAQILELMNGLKKELNMGIIFITHNMGVVAKMADRIAVMYAGQVVESGTAEDVFYRPKHPYTWGLIGSMPSLTGEVPERLFSIPGTPPDLFAPPKGCGFASRCQYCMNACVDHLPPEFEVSPGHKVRCWLMDERCSAEIVPPCGTEKTLRPKKEEQK